MKNCINFANRFIVIFLVGCIWPQAELVPTISSSTHYKLTNHAEIRYGGAANVNHTDLNSNALVQKASIVVGDPVIGYTKSSNYSTDMGFYAFYLKEPDPPLVHASKAQYADKVKIKWVQDVLSPPAFHPDDVGVTFDDAAYAGYNGDHKIFRLFKDEDGSGPGSSSFYADFGPIDPNTDEATSHDGVFNDGEVAPGDLYTYEVEASNAYGFENIV